MSVERATRGFRLEPAPVLLASAVGVTAAAADQLSKRWALDALADGQRIDLLPTVWLQLVRNPGVAFGLGGTLGPLAVLGLFVLVLTLLVLLVVRLRRREPLLGSIALAVAVGGAVGNLVDRVARARDQPLSGEVVDFIVVDWFAVFNGADIFVTCGLAGWALSAAAGARRIRRAADRPETAT